MSNYKQGDIAVLVSGSPRLAVEAVDGDNISVIWCNEGIIHRDTFHTGILKKWEGRDDAGRSFGSGGRDTGKRFDGPRGGDRGGDRGGPKGKTGWDGKPREKSSFRK